MISQLKRATSPYFSQTRSLKYSYLIALPLLILYEVLILLSAPEGEYMVRLTADMWFKNIFTYLGLDSFLLTFVVAAVLGIVVFVIERHKSVSYRPRFFGYMILESTIYAVILAMLISGFVGFLFNGATDGNLQGLSFIQKIALSIGAGLYEELVFRVLLVGALLYILRWTKMKPGLINASAMIIAALIFSSVHYMGNMADTFTLASFTFRFLFGLALNGVLIYRGFGIAAWTHSIYDIMVVTLWS
ncbi:MAG: CPBP family intramembrane metalloprotease [Bacteroidetes bacterium]|nr:CPBP family intramembrane metalloprotease [Bacteroidota bacterium]MCH8523933.1 CPBP family intramembrane metalloprotease [Balneolales bacterium]